MSECTQMERLSDEATDLLDAMVQSDPRGEGLIETDIIYDEDDGTFMQATYDALHELMRAGCVQNSHPHIDVTEKGRRLSTALR